MAKRRRGQGEGSIYKRADGKWRASITIGYDENGRRKRRYLYGHTKSQVLEKLNETNANLRFGAVS